MSTASNRNLAASVRERDRRTALSLESPGTPGVAQAGYLMPNWDAEYGSLREQAGEGGYRLSGNGMSLPDSGGTTRPGDEDIARTWAINRSLGEMTDQRKVQDQSLRAMTAGADIAQTQAGQAQRDLRDRDTLDRNLAPTAAPTAVTRTPGVNGQPDTITARPAGPVDPRQMLLNSLPGHMRPQMEQTLAAMDEKAAENSLAARKQTEVERENRAKDAAAAPFVVPHDASGVPLTGDALLQTLPTAKQKLVTAVLEGRQAIPSGTALKDPYWKGVLETANLIDPNFDTVNYNARANTRKDFTSGTASKQINAINTVVGHLSDLADAGGELGNGGMNWMNAIHNKLTIGGSKRGVALNNFETLKEGVATELMRVWRQAGVGTEKEIEDWKAQIGATKSPQELQGAFKTVGGMLESKLGALDSQYKQGMGTDKVSAIMPESRAKLDKLQGLGAATGGPAEGTRQPIPGGSGIAEYRNGKWIRVQ